MVRAVLDTPAPGRPRWRGQVTDVTSGERRTWAHPAGIAHFVEARLAAAEATPGGATTPDPATGRGTTDSSRGDREAPSRGAGPTPVADDAPVRRAAVMAAPAMTDVVNDMLAILDARLPGPTASLPDPNVTLVSVRERLVGLGGLRGTTSSSPLGPQVLKGGRLAGQVRFQLWGASSSDVDDAIVALHGTLLDQGDQLRADGFLRFAATDTSVAEHVDEAGGWRKTTAYDVLYEFTYRDSDDAPALIARIPVHTDPERPDSPERETSTVTDEMVRWDDEGAASLVVAGPASVRTIDVLGFVPGPTPGGAVTLRRSDGGAGPPQDHPDVPSFLAATAGEAPTTTDARVVLSPTAFLAALDPAGDTVDLGDWDTDGVTDTYDPVRLVVDPAIELASSSDRLEIAYSDPTGLDEQAVLYVRANAP